jgi:phage shock protein A
MNLKNALIMGLRVAFAALIFVLIACGFYFGLKSSYFRSKMASLNLDYKNVASDFERINRQNLELKNKFSLLQKEFDAISLDRNNLIVQAKSLLSEKNRANELVNSIEKIKQDNASLEENNAEIASQNLDIKGQLEKLTTDYEAVVKDKKELEASLEKERDLSQVNKLIEDIASVQKAYEVLSGSVKQKEMEIDKLKVKNSHKD